MLAIVRIRGSVSTRAEVEMALVQMGLKEKHACVIIPSTPAYRGMVQKIKDYVTWGDVSDTVAKKLLQAKKLEAGKDATNPYKGIIFHLAPPKKGFRGSIKLTYPRGALGPRGDKINELLERMI
ncbi:MAG: uL30 family ribosomal protein [Candidatus Aenigmarchaeota archaeon]|nr:uL30 family ribosomal protein [Candidatus Aenigmarchaeota archaeon]